MQVIQNNAHFTLSTEYVSQMNMLFKHTKMYILKKIASKYL